MKTPTIKNVAEIKSYLVETPLVIDGGIASVRTNKATAMALLLENDSVIKGGNVHFFTLKHLGLGVYDVKLRQHGKINTCIVDAFEPHKIADHPGAIPTIYY